MKFIIFIIFNKTNLKHTAIFRLMLFNVDKLTSKLDALTDFIPLYSIPSQLSDNKEQTIYINKNAISCFSHLEKDKKECLLLRFDHNKLAGTAFPRSYLLCKEDNPYAFNEIFKGKHLVPKLNDDNTF